MSRQAHEEEFHDGRVPKPKPHEVGVQIPRGVHFYLNLNNVYMTLMMVAPMTILMLVFMRSMYESRRLNWIIGAVAALVFIASFAAMRTQAAIGDMEFLNR